MLLATCRSSLRWGAVARQGALGRDRSETRHNLPINFISLARAYKFTCMRIQTGARNRNLGGHSRIVVIGGRRKDKTGVANRINSSLNCEGVALRGYAPPRRHVREDVLGNLRVVSAALCHWGNGSSSIGAQLQEWVDQWQELEK